MLNKRPKPSEMRAARVLRSARSTLKKIGQTYAEGCCCAARLLSKRSAQHRAARPEATPLTKRSREKRSVS